MGRLCSYKDAPKVDGTVTGRLYPHRDRSRIVVQRTSRKLPVNKPMILDALSGILLAFSILTVLWIAITACSGLIDGRKGVRRFISMPRPRRDPARRVLARRAAGLKGQAVVSNQGHLHKPQADDFQYLFEHEAFGLPEGWRQDLILRRN